MKINRIFLLIIGLTIFFNGVNAQTVKMNVSNEETTMTVSGTSTLHDWTSEVKTVNGFVEVDEKMIDKQKIKKGEEIPLVDITIPVTAIISPRGATMDKKTYSALKSESHPEINFKLENCKITDMEGSDFQLNAAGNLTIAGITKKVEFPVAGKLVANDKMSFAGAYKLNMLDYDMEPPSAMFGQIETGEEVEIKFELIVVK